jgi:hypothetical protein
MNARDTNIAERATQAGQSPVSRAVLEMTTGGAGSGMPIRGNADNAGCLPGTVA